MRIDLVCVACEQKSRVNLLDAKQAETLPEWAEKPGRRAWIVTCPACGVRSEFTMRERGAGIAPKQVRTISLVYKSGLCSYVFESPEGHWGVRFCDRPWRGGMMHELPEPLRGWYPSAAAAVQAIADVYQTSVLSQRVTPRL
jgi:hypothetical protein